MNLKSFAIIRLFVLNLKVQTENIVQKSRRFLATRRRPGTCPVNFDLGNDLVHSIARAEWPHGIGRQGIYITFEVLLNGQHMRFKIAIGHVGSLKAPLTTAISCCIESTALAAKRHTPVRKEILALPRFMVTAVYGAAYHVNAEAVLTFELVAVIILYNWSNHASLIAECEVVIRVQVIEAVICFHNTPAVVTTTGNDVHFLITVLLNVGHEELVVAASVEGHPPRVSKTICEDLASSTFLINKWIVRRYPILVTITL